MTTISRRHTAVLALAACLAAAPATTHARPGELDPSFGTAGVATAPTADTFASAQGIAIQADGRIVAVGRTRTDPGPDAIVVARFLADGTLDASFGGTGVVVELFAPDTAHATDVAIQSDGNIVVIGTAGPVGAQDVVLLRYEPDGTPDATFGVAGVAVTDLGADDFGTALAFDADGNIVATEWTGSGPPYLGYHSVLARYLPDGQPDSTFGTGGFTFTDFGGLRDDPTGLAIQPADGKIVVSGRTFEEVGVDERITMARYLPDGTPDGSFGIAGRVVTPFNGVAGANALALQPDGRIVAAGTDTFPSSSAVRAAVVRYLADGTLDASFGDGGKVQLITGFSTTAQDVRIQADGRIVIAGSLNSHVMVARLLPDGTRDGSWGNEGSVGLLCSIAEAVDLFGIGTALALDATENVVVAGRSSDELVVARFVGGEGGPTFCPALGQCPTASRHKLTVTGLPAPAGDERLKLEGRTLFDTTAGLDPATDGVRLFVVDTDNVAVLDVTVPGGAYDPITRTGWKTAGSGRAWTYRGPGDATQGIESVAIKAPNGALAIVKFKVAGRNAYAVDTTQLPLSATLLLSPPGGFCIQAFWPAPPPASGSCRLPGAPTLVCK